MESTNTKVRHGASGLSKHHDMGLELRTDQIYKIIRTKLADFDEQVQASIEEAE